MDPLDSIQIAFSVAVAWMVCVWALAIGIGGVLLGNFATFITFKAAARPVLPPLPQKPLLISVIIPTLNDAGSIVRTLTRVRQSMRTNAHAEIIVVDGGSNDGTVACIRRLNDDFKVVEGVVGTRARRMNVGARIATGHFLIFLYADTLLTFLAAGGFPDQPIFEMYELVRRIHRMGKIKVVEDVMVVSLEGGRCLGMEGEEAASGHMGPSPAVTSGFVSPSMHQYPPSNKGLKQTPAFASGRGRAPNAKNVSAYSAWSVGMNIGGLGGAASRATLAMSFCVVMYSYLGMSADAVFQVLNGLPNEHRKLPSSGSGPGTTTSFSAGAGPFLVAPYDKKKDDEDDISEDEDVRDEDMDSEADSIVSESGNAVDAEDKHRPSNGEDHTTAHTANGMSRSKANLAVLPAVSLQEFRGAQSGLSSHSGLSSPSYTMRRRANR
ncbi:hypothetical protein HK101_006192 [Irineochytrium annulatum]|nr:hypothetical protein HK101_006192 [Irineochytrium annulatum]